MGLRSPQQTLSNQPLNPTQSPTFQATAAPQIDTRPLAREINRIQEEMRWDERRRQQNAARQANEAERKSRMLAQSKFKRARDNLRVTAESELSTNKGINTLQAYPDRRRWLQERMDELVANQPSIYREDMLELAEDGLGSFDRFGIKYSISEADKTIKDTLKSNVATAIQDAVDNSGDVDFFNGNGVDSVIRESLVFSEQQYGADDSREISPGVTVGEVKRRNVQQAVSSAIHQGITQEIAKGNIANAQTLLDTGSEKMTPSDRQKALKAIEKGSQERDSDVALGVANTAFDELPDNPQAAELLIRDMTDNGRQYTQAISMYRGKLALQKEQSEVNTTRNKNMAYQNYRRNGNPGAEFKNLDPEDQMKVLKNINETGGLRMVVTDQDELRKLRARVDGMTSSELAQLDTKSLEHLIAKDDLAPILSMKNRALQEQRGQYTAVQAGSTQIPKSVAESEAKLRGIKTSGASARTGRRLQEEMSTMLIAKQEELLNENPKITRRELEARLRQEAKRFEVYKDKEYGGWFPGLTRRLDIFGNFGTEVKRVRQVEAESMGTPTSPSQGAADPLTATPPQEFVDRVKSTRQQKGLRPYSDSEMVELYERLNQNRE